MASSNYGHHIRQHHNRYVKVSRTNYRRSNISVHRYSTVYYHPKRITIHPIYSLLYVI